MNDRIVIDTSSLIAVGLREPAYEVFMEKMLEANELHLSAVSRVELGIVAKNIGIEAQISELLLRLDIQVAAFDAIQADFALGAFTQYGKGRHPAALNFGDCCSYALAKSLNLPLLFKGNDFSQTDILPAVV
jgi:ribonuclease VapC